MRVWKIQEIPLVYLQAFFTYNFNTRHFSASHQRIKIFESIMLSIFLHWSNTMQKLFIWSTTVFSIWWLEMTQNNYSMRWVFIRKFDLVFTYHEILDSLTNSTPTHCKYPLRPRHHYFICVPTWPSHYLSRYFCCTCTGRQNPAKTPRNTFSVPYNI